MRGLNDLAAMRRRGFRPGLGVLLEVHPALVPSLDPNDMQAAGEVALLECSEGEAFDRLDLRPLLGLRVLVAGESERFVRAAAVAAVGAGAAEVNGIVRRWRDGRTERRTVFSHNGWMTEADQWQA